MSERENKIYILTWLVVAAFMPVFSLAFYANSWWPLLGSLLSLGIIVSYVAVPLYVLERYGLDRRGYNLYAHRLEALLDFLPWPFGRPERSWPDLKGIKLELSSFFLISLTLLVPYVGAFYGFMRVQAYLSGQELWFSLNFPPEFIHLIATQIFLIALPEEFFWRGFVQGILLEKWPNERSLGGVPLGRAIIVTNALFALAHFMLGFNPVRLLTFFPGLVFSALVFRHKSLLAAILFHALCNILAVFLYGSLILR